MQKLELIELLERVFERMFNFRKKKSRNNFEEQNNKQRKYAYRFIINNNRYQ